jgi:hypothetical protein
MNKEKEVKIIDFHKSTDEILRTINGYVCNMHNQLFLSLCKNISIYNL